ncbi:MAG: HNH endonuclease [Propionibacteriaceae bacterium]|nr:HNH endonuclease [Propionibacteriaceae bacterium]
MGVVRAVLPAGGLCTSDALELVRLVLGSVDHEGRAGEPARVRLGHIREVLRLRSMVDALAGRLSAEAEASEECVAAAGVPVTSFIASSEPVSGREAARMVRQGAQVAAVPELQEACLAGKVSAAQASVIVDNLGQLPDGISKAQQEHAVERMIDSAQVLAAPSLKRMLPALIDEVSPDRTEELIEARLRRERELALKNRYIRFSDDRRGSILFQGQLPRIEGLAFRKLVDAFMHQQDRERANALKEHTIRAAAGQAGNLAGAQAAGCRDGHRDMQPAEQAGNLAGKQTAGRNASGQCPAGGNSLDGQGSVDVDGLAESMAGVLDPGQRRADGLSAMVAALQQDRVAPIDGGDRPRITVTINYQDLKAECHRARLIDDNQPISAQELRLLACDADILPVVLGGQSEPLDVGRAQRLATGPIRQALETRDGGCVFPGCDTPPSRCHAHHIIPWQKGGPTTINNLALLCPHHHGLIEPDPSPHADPAAKWTLQILDNLSTLYRPHDTTPIRHSRFLL